MMDNPNTSVIKVSVGRKTKTSMIKIGPVGNLNSGEWDEKGRTEIVQIFVSHDDQIHSLQFQYYENGSLFLSDIHGQSNGNKFDVVKLDYPSEYLTCISGFKFPGYLTSITFTTNRGTYGPFGQAARDNREFRFQLGQDRQFGGFCGTADYCVRSIGVYFKPITTLKLQEKQNGSPVEEKEVDT
ncbi:hypothetical protein ACH5RR_031013 [Cinchona calisaya]|uniref:Jacalin-type lectin domain-containing protein n=1 Tax=Cinchona calisaya TaxID=153742 RepID=A0ABD2YFZ6_9GENT